MWLGVGHLLQQVDISDIPVLASTVRVVQSARDLGVTLDSQLSLSAHITALCRAGFYQLRQIRQAIRSLTWRCQDHCPGVHRLSFGLLQLAAGWCAGKPAERCSQCRMLPLVCSLAHADVTTSLRYAASVTMTAGSETSGIQDGLPSTTVASFTCYLTADIHLVSEFGRRPLRSSTDRTLTE